MFIRTWPSESIPPTSPQKVQFSTQTAETQKSTGQKLAVFLFADSFLMEKRKHHKIPKSIKETMTNLNMERFTS